MKTMKAILYKVILLLLLVNGIAAGNYGEWERIINLSGKWKFSIGDDMKWAQPNFNDDGWERVYAPAYWEDEGFHGYDGYAWYRKQFYFPKNYKDANIYFRSGGIDDVDEVYVNGNMIGSSGSFPPDYKTAYNAIRLYKIPVKYLNINGNNMIAVRVYDSQLGGGIASGDIGIFVNHSVQPDISLEGNWRFKTGNISEWKEKKFDDSHWDNVYVPSLWEAQGYKDYDGFAWYRTKINIPDRFKGKQLVLVLGRIDDMDETYLNGRMIGSTGELDDPNNMDDAMERAQREQSWGKFRGYYIPKDLIVYNQENVIAVKVYDGYIGGGIYQGPIGIMTQETYTKYWRDRKKRDNFKDRDIFDLIFGN